MKQTKHPSEPLRSYEELNRQLHGLALKWRDALDGMEIKTEKEARQAATARRLLDQCLRDTAPKDSASRG